MAEPTEPETTGSNGRRAQLPELAEAERAERRRMIEAMEEAHDFPGFYKVVVIAESDDGFRASLVQLVEVSQAEAPYRMQQRPSRRGTYVAYHLELYVETAGEALNRKSLLAQLEGVRVLI